MKRIILSILVAAICTAGHAQSITGSWKGSPVKESQNGIESINTTDHVFKADGTFTETSNVSASIAFPINKADTLYTRFTTNVHVDGTYTLQGSKLMLKYNHKQAEGSLESIDVWSNSTSIQAEIDKKKDSIASIADKIMVKELKKAYKGVNGEKAILTLTTDTLEYRNDDGLTYSFKRL